MCLASWPSQGAWTGPAPMCLLGRQLLSSSFPPPPLLAAPASGLPKNCTSLYYYTGHIFLELFVSNFAPMANCENSSRAGSNSYSSLYDQPWAQGSVNTCGTSARTGPKGMFANRNATCALRPGLASKWGGERLSNSHHA